MKAPAWPSFSRDLISFSGFNPAVRNDGLTEHTAGSKANWLVIVFIVVTNLMG